MMFLKVVKWSYSKRDVMTDTDCKFSLKYWTLEAEKETKVRVERERGKEVRMTGRKVRGRDAREREIKKNDYNK